MKKNRLKASLRIATSLLVSAAIIIQPAAQAAGLQSQLNGVFDSMTNVTTPGVFETQRRGVIAGGRATMKNRIFSENIVSFSPPSWKAGCGGIDLFGGSFSFINSEQLTQLLRAVAANAAGYAFQLAIKTICSECATILETLQKKIQQLNQFMGNSCQLAQGLVNDLTSGMDLKGKTEDSLIASGKGFFEDMFTGWSQSSGESSTAAVAKNAPELLKTGNIVWMQLKRSGAANWFRIQGDNQLLEAIMSLTGSVIIQEPTGDDQDTQPITDLPGNKISLEDLVVGGTVETYSCAGDYDKCMNAGASGAGNKSETLVGLKTQLEDVLLGQTGLNGDGLVGKYAHNIGTPTPTEAAISSNLPLGLGTQIFNLATASEEVARSFVTQQSGAIASAMAYTVALESLRVAQAALSGEDSAYVIKAQQAIDRSRRNIDAQYEGLVNRYGRLSDSVALYNSIMTNVRKSTYLRLGTQTSGTK